MSLNHLLEQARGPWVWDGLRIDAASEDSDVADRVARRTKIHRSAIGAFWLACIAVCVVVPAWNYLRLQRWVFRLRHYLRHDVLRRYRHIHGSRLYHNQSLKIACFWLAITAFCSLFRADGDLAQITKRLGRIAVALMPPLLFLTLRPSPLPHTLYLTLVPLHKWLSRVVVLISVIHTALYSWYFLETGVFLTKMKKPANYWGVVALTLFLLIAVTSVSQTRRRNYRAFYYVHYLSTVFTVVLLHFHARPPIPYYTAMNATILLAQIVYRVWHTAKTMVSVLQISSTLAIVEFPLKDLVKKPILPSSHIRVSRFNERSIFSRIFHQLVPFQHPYTIASLPTDDTVKLIVRCGKFQLRSGMKLLVTGVFEPRIDFLQVPTKTQLLSSPEVTLRHNSQLRFIVSARRAFMVVGGSAISFGLPLLRILNFNGVTVRLIWVTRDFKDLTLLNHFKNNFDGLEIYITQPVGGEQDLQIDYIDFENNLENNADTRERSPLLGSSRSESKYGTTSTMPTSFENSLENHGKSNEADEIDFTQIYSVGNLRRKTKFDMLSAGAIDSSVFRKPSVVTAPVDQIDSDIEDGEQMANSNTLKIPAGVKVFFGRPNLTNADYQWCLERECIGPSITNDCSYEERFRPGAKDLSHVWVVAAGPHGLVENTKRWATDGGLHFHEESFTL
ncbi:LAMI_0G02762g1_1 [Lachancea mirantina]|uniref:LAMI_0G02762g1_1 n=1 Tax=Lachancea mirantina TaxID=1230905 RepID=A0A1G4K831_9SACH|nr:LAMI_0G02762g1_1 [Lachancea mirantina]